MYILFDIGGTNTRIAKALGEDKFDTPTIFPTLKLYKEGIELIKKIILDISKGEKIDAIVGGIAGPWNRKEKHLIASPNLPDWVEQPLQSDLQIAFDTKVYVENDAAMVGLGEAHVGAGKGFPIVVYITVSTGVGGARIVDGVIDRKVIGFEPGHQIVDLDKTIIPEAHGIDLENMIGGRWIEDRTGMKPSEIMDDQFWDKLARVFAAGLNNTIMHWSPDVVVLGGSMMKKIGLPFDRVEAHLRQMITIYPELPKLVKSELGDLGGLYGALSYLKQLK